MKQPNEFLESRIIFDMKCELCGRENICTFHHLIPKFNHKKKWFKKNFTKEQMNEGIYVCKYECHKEIHNLISEKELGKIYNTLEKLLAHENIAKYIKFIKKQKLR